MEKTHKYVLGQKVRILHSDYFLGLATPELVVQDCYGVVTILFRGGVRLCIHFKKDDSIVDAHKDWLYYLDEIAPWKDKQGVSDANVYD